MLSIYIDITLSNVTTIIIMAGWRDLPDSLITNLFVIRESGNETTRSCDGGDHERYRRHVPGPRAPPPP
jgi:hypothetical protein